MSKMQRLYSRLGEATQANNGEYGYFVTVEDLIKHDGHEEFFRKVSKSGKRISKSVFYGLKYDKSERAYFANNWNDISSDSGALKKTDIVFIGFDF